MVPEQLRHLGKKRMHNQHLRKTAPLKAGGRTRTILGRPGVEDRAAGGPGRSPCMRAWRRAEASAGPVWVRWQERSAVARGGGPKERWRSRGCRPAARRGVAEAGRRGGRATPGVV